jgi:hypothetical protein
MELPMNDDLGITEDQAIRMVHSNWWVGMAPRDIAMFQMHERRLCMPFHVFHAAMEEALGRPVYTHEFALDRSGLLQELLGERPALTLNEILQLIPASKRVVVWPDGQVDGVPQ